MGLLPETEPFLSVPERVYADDPEAVTLIEYGLPPELPFVAEVILPCASTVISALVYDPAVTAVLSRLIVPDAVIGPPLRPVPVEILVTVPLFPVV